MLPLVGIGLCAASLLVNIIGLAIPYWESFESTDTFSSHYGLWSMCVSYNGNSQCNSISDTDLDGAYIKATRAMVILGMLTILGALVCGLLKQLLMKDKALLPKIGAGCAILAGVLMFIGAIIFVAGKKSTSVPSNLHAGFALCIVAGVIGIAAGIVMFLGTKGD